MIIGIAGKKNAGKDTLAEFLVANGFSKYAFADHLRIAASSIFQLPINLFTDSKLKDKPFTKKRWLRGEVDTPIAMDLKTRMRFVEYFRKTYSFDMMNDLEVFHGQSFSCPRDILKFIGTKVCRDIIDPDFHVKYVLNQIQSDDYARHQVISDARFENERKGIESTGGINILITRDEAEQNIDADISENDLGSPEDYFYVVENNKDLKHLSDEAFHILELISKENLHQ